ncbi:MAG TPA: Imm32 family immunity protein [Acidobacteriota bacterium]
METGGHDHLMTPAWAGHELTEERQGDNTKLVNMVTIACVK